MKEKKARVEDALHATRAAVEEGIVPGGGVALLRAQKALESLEAQRRSSRSASTSSGARSKSRCARSSQNAGEEGSIVVQKVREGKGTFGFNAQTSQYGDLVADGVIDPVKVVRSRAAERGQRRGPDAHDRGARRREAQGREAGSRRRPRPRRRRLLRSEACNSRSRSGGGKERGGSKGPPLSSFGGQRTNEARLAATPSVLLQILGERGSATTESGRNSGGWLGPWGRRRRL